MRMCYVHTWYIMLVLATWYVVISAGHKTTCAKSEALILVDEPQPSFDSCFLVVSTTFLLFSLFPINSPPVFVRRLTPLSPRTPLYTKSK